jgi:antitoxin component YwqK of YwqJK toxin-antitoxin module
MTPTSPIPETADERIDATWEDGSKKIATYWIAGQQVGYRHWEPDGQLSMEYGMQDGRRHGPFRTWHEDGQIHEDATYHEGKEHGTTRQYDETGMLIGSYTMVHGTGVDLWFSQPGVLSEERYCEDGQRHGYERWWNDDNTTVWQESHYHHGIEHGVFRRWNQHGRLRRGYPQYFVAGQRMTKRQYLRAQASDPSLPPFDERENLPNRVLSIPEKA